MHLLVVHASKRPVICAMTDVKVFLKQRSRNAESLKLWKLCVKSLLKLMAQVLLQW